MNVRLKVEIACHSMSDHETGCQCKCRRVLPSCHSWVLGVMHADVSGSIVKIIWEDSELVHLTALKHPFLPTRLLCGDLAFLRLGHIDEPQPVFPYL